MASKKYGYVLTEKAEADINETFEYIAFDLSNADAAEAFIDEFESIINETCKAPKTGRRVDNEYLKRDDVYRFLVNNYIAYYLIDEATHNVVVLRVVYGGRDQDRILKNI